MAPECATRGARVDGRADLYALGVIGYELAFGCMPYTGQLHELIAAHQQGGAKFDLPTKCSPRMLKLLRRMIAPNPDARVQSAEELLQLLEATPALPPTGSPGAFMQPTTASDDFSSLSRFIEDRFSGSFTDHAQGRVVHSSGRERLLVWGVLAAVVATLAAGFVLR
jgi:serine/threonine protein kinase